MSDRLPADHKILLSVDMDEWFYIRWVTGTPRSIWPDTASFFRDYYDADRPQKELLRASDKVLDLFERYRLHGTFFFTGEIANHYPDLVKRVAGCGHEIGCHNYLHQDYTREKQAEFREHVRKAKGVLEDLCGHEVVGYRAPNSVVDNYLIRELLDAGFRYDSSITPTRPMLGKWGMFTEAPLNPYQLSIDNFVTPGDSGLWEFPWPVFP